MVDVSGLKLISRIGPRKLRTNMRRPGRELVNILSMCTRHGKQKSRGVEMHNDVANYLLQSGKPNTVNINTN